MKYSSEIASSSPSTISLFFDGDACNVDGKLKAGFIGRFIVPFQEMVKTEYSFLLSGTVGERGRARESDAAELYVSMLNPIKRGIELSTKPTLALFGESDLALAVENVLQSIQALREHRIDHLEALGDRRQRYAKNLVKLFKELHGERSSLAILHNGSIVSMSSEDVERILDFLERKPSETWDEVLLGRLDGGDIRSGRFTAILPDGFEIKGKLAHELDGDLFGQIARKFFGINCMLHLTVTEERGLLGDCSISYLLRNVTE